ncbi:MAG: hypothetical protein IK012_08255 [Fibrobacter sp.]|uniref:hypothetical protein n=1 Tax=Fibrobacter sp. TaxID=35828 RepID=UPI0025C6DB35|nr:hypothetical protein [Fibrobacter sp.]MBR4785228.1 hypothetical protein [Fibrobacter sp.]
MRLITVLLLLAFVAGFAAPVKAATAPARLFGAVDSRTEFSGGRLFAVLDSVGGTGTWMEWDVNGIRDPSVMYILDPLLASSNKPKMVWVISERITPLMAVLLPKGSGEALVFYELSALDAKPVPLQMNRVLSPDVVFRDYRLVGASEFVHLDRPNLRVVATDKTIRFSYTNPDATPLRFDRDFAKKTVVEKKNEVRNYRDFFDYEYVLMLRAFVQSTRGLFNWQAWHWYMPAFNSRAMISDAELEAILSKGVPPQSVTIFKMKASGGQWVEFKTNGNGFYEMVITNP